MFNFKFPTFQIAYKFIDRDLYYNQDCYAT